MVDRPGVLESQVCVDGRYVLRHKLGRGAFGEVWYAIDLKWSRGTRPYALKFMQPTGSGTITPFSDMLEEADVLLSLAHENIVMLRNYGTHGRFSWLALDYVAGGSLDSLIVDRRRRGSRGLDSREACWLLHQLARAVDFAHKRGVVHRDIKPANILLDTQVEGALDRSSATVRLGDFGLALPAGILGVENPGGTIAFMAPELFTKQGVVTKADLRAADVYALGATVFAAVAGTPPFGTQGDLIRAIVQTTAPPLDSGDSALDAAVSRALSPDPSRRWPNAAAFARAAGESGTATSVQVSRSSVAETDECTPPILFVQRAMPFRVDRNASLQIGFANPLNANIEGRVFFEPIDSAALVVPTPDRGFSLRSGAGDWMQTSIRPAQPGRHRLRLRAVVRVAGKDTLHSFEATVIIIVAAGSGSPGSGGPGGSAAGEGVAAPALQKAPESSAADSFRDLLANAAGCTVRDLLLLHATASFPASGIDAPRAGAPIRDAAAISVMMGDTLIRRLYVRFGHVARFGRVPASAEGPNEFAWVRQPCRSAELDPENWNLTCRLSRRAGALQASADGSTLRATSDSIRFDDRDLSPGELVSLRSNREHRVDMGGIEFAVRARRASGNGRDLCRLLVEQPLQSTLASNVLPTTTRHHCIHLRRIDNLPEIEYALACPWVGLGGDPSDDIVLPGLPPDSLLLAHRSGVTMALVSSSLSPIGDWRPRPGLWTPIVEGDGLRYQRLSLVIHSTSAAAMAADLGSETSR